MNPGEITKHELENSKDSSWHFDEHPFYIILNFGGGLVSEHEVIENTPDYSEYRIL